MRQLVLFVALGACSSTPPVAPVAVVAPPPSTSVARPASSAPPKLETKKVPIPSWIAERLANGAAMSLVGGDADSVEILFGQFEHRDEAIVRFDRKTGCASEVIGPWPALTKVARGNEDIGKPALSRAEILRVAASPAFAKELASIVSVYTKRKKLGEDKLTFSADGQHLVMEAGDEHLIASSDGGAHFQYLDGAFAGLPAVSPDGRFAIVRLCTQGNCGAPPRGASYRPALVAFDSLPKTTLLAGPTMHDAIFDRASSAWVLVRSDAFGRKDPSKICLDLFRPIDAAAPKPLACVPTTTAGYWRMASASPSGTFAVIAATNAKGAVRLSVRSLLDGSEKDAYDVPGDWEKYQWLSVLVSDEGRIAYEEGGSYADPIGGSRGTPGRVVVRGGGGRREIPSVRPMGWLSSNELVVLDRTSPPQAEGCGLVRVEAIEK